MTLNVINYRKDTRLVKDCLVGANKGTNEGTCQLLSKKPLYTNNISVGDTGFELFSWTK